MRADVTVGSFLSGGIDSTAVAALAEAAQPQAADVHHRLRARGLQRDRRRGRVGRGDRRRAHHQGRVGRGDDGDAAADRLVPRRPGGRPGARAAVLHRPRGPQARQGRAVRRGRRRAVRRLHDLPRADLAARRSATCRRRRGAGSASCRPASPRAGAARTCCAAARSASRSATTATRASSVPTRCRGSTARYDPVGLLHGRHPRPLRADDAPRRLDPDAVRRPVHLAARRHPRQGRQDDDGQLARAARARSSTPRSSPSARPSPPI